MKLRKKSMSVISVILCMLLLFSAYAVNGTNNEDETKSTAGEETVTSAEPTEVGGPDIGKNEDSGKKPSTEKLIAITYDDGPNPSTTNRILDTLEKNGSVATFFILGSRIDNGPESIRRAIKMGCEIANHTYNHEYINQISDSKRNNQINSVNEKMKSEFGYDVELLRAPGGKFKGVTDKVDMPLIQWSIDTNDWRHKDVSGKHRTEEQRQKEMNDIVDDVMENAKSGDIILMHDIYDFTADLTEILVPKLVENGFKLVTVSEMYEAYGESLEAGEVYYNCYVKQAYHTIEPIPAGKYAVATQSGGGLNLRSEASTSAEILIEIPNGTELYVTEAVKGWAKVSYNGFEGWVSTGYIKPVS